MTALRLALAAAGIALGVLAYRVQIDNLGALTSSTRALAIVAVAWAFLGAGLIAWARRPGNRLGPLLTAAGFALLARQFRYSHDELAFTVFFALSELSYGLAAHSVLAYPSGHVRGRAEQWLVRVGYASVLLFPLAILLVYEGAERLRFMDPRPHESLLLVWDNGSLAVTLQRIFVVWVWGVLATIFIALVVRRLARATPRARRLLAPLCLAAVVFALRAVYEGIFAFVDRPSALVDDVLFWWQIAGFMALPIALVAGMLRARLARANVGELVLELERTPPEGVRGALARALDDPALEVGFWLPERLEYVDGHGRPLVLPGEDDDRAVTHLDHDGEPVAVIVHDASLVDEPELLLASGAAARLALENSRLHADMRAQLLEVQESRVRIVQAADEERRRIERDLHDGAQQRLVALAMDLGMARAKLETDPAAGAALVGEAHEEAKRALAELRDLARGIHPAVLADRGLDAAISALAARSPVPVDVDVATGRLPGPVESTAYFVVVEALTNAAKHARAAEIGVRITRHRDLLIVEVIDDGAGGADPARGTGLRGLADRVAAVDGRLAITSPPGGPTVIRAELPYGS